jgi:hypothetical protein
LCFLFCILIMFRHFFRSRSGGAVAA